MNSPIFYVPSAVVSSWDRLWLAERKKKKNTLFLSFCPTPWQSSIQDWGEEVEEGAVYHVTLKRVQIQQAANKGARWLGVSKAGETVNFGLAVSVFCEYHYLAEAGFPSPPFPPIISFNLKKGNYSDQVFAVAVLVCFPKYLPRFVNNSEPLGNILRYLANRVGMEWQNVAQNYRTRK